MRLKRSKKNSAHSPRISLSRPGLMLIAMAFCFSQYFLQNRVFQLRQERAGTIPTATRQLGENAENDTTAFGVEAQQVQAEQEKELKEWKEKVHDKFLGLKKNQNVTHLISPTSNSTQFLRDFRRQQLLNALSATNRQDYKLPTTPNPPVNSTDGSPCTGVYFWGGGKAGSTTLAMYLKHEKEGKEWDSQGEFLDLPKEICWALSGSTSEWLMRTHNKCSSQFKFAVDGCPRLYSTIHAMHIRKHDPDAKLLMLVRDPVDRLVSHLNDHLRRGGKTFQIDKQVVKLLNTTHVGIEVKLSKYGSNLQSILQEFPPEQVLVIHTQALQTHPQPVMDRIMEFLGGQRKHVLVQDANDGSSMRGYQQISNETQQLMRRYFANDVALLEQTMGRKFPWNDWVPTPEGVVLDVDTTWIAETPKPVPNLVLPTTSLLPYLSTAVLPKLSFRKQTQVDLVKKQTENETIVNPEQANNTPMQHEVLA